MPLTSDGAMVNLPSFAQGTLLTVLLANAALLLTVFLLAGPTIVAGRDMLGRPLPGLSIVRRIVLATVLIMLSAFLAAQALVLVRFWPYYLDSGATATEQVISMSAVPAGHPLTWWINTPNHRFGVTPDIFSRLAVGDQIEARFRLSDDALYEVRILEQSDALPSSTN